MCCAEEPKPALGWMCFRRTGRPVTHVVVVAELLTGVRDSSEQQDLDRFLTQFQVLAVVERDCRSSLDLLRRYRLSYGIGWNDCMIAATSLRLSRAVITTNDKHFAAIAGLTVFRPY